MTSAELLCNLRPRISRLTTSVINFSGTWRKFSTPLANFSGSVMPEVPDLWQKGRRLHVEVTDQTTERGGELDSLLSSDEPLDEKDANVEIFEGFRAQKMERSDLGNNSHKR